MSFKLVLEQKQNKKNVSTFLQKRTSIIRSEHFGCDEIIKLNHTSSVRHFSWKKKNMRCQLSSLEANGWIAEEPERWDRASVCKGALLQPLQSMFWSHLAHPDRWQHKSVRPWLRGLRHLLFTKNVTSSFTSPSNWSTKMKETRPTAYRHRPMTRSSELRKGFHS